MQRLSLAHTLVRARTMAPVSTRVALGSCSTVRPVVRSPVPAACSIVPHAAAAAATLHTSAALRAHAADRPELHGTTILAVRKGQDVVLIGDGQVSQGGTVFKPNARKVRVIGNGKVLVGFAGSTADCFALLDVFEKKLEEYSGQLLRAGVELAKMWRTDKFLRHLNSQLIAVDKDMSIILSGDGDVISEPMDGVIGIGSGGLFALAAARALVDRPDLDARQVAVKSMRIAAEICVYTNTNFTIEAFEKGELISGEKRAARDAEDRANAEAADREERRKVERNTAITQQVGPNGTTTTPGSGQK